MKKYLNVMKTVDLFRNIEEVELLPLLSCLSANMAHFEKGETIFLSGEKIKQFGIVLSGQVQIVQDDYYGNRSILAEVNQGIYLGILCLLEIKCFRSWISSTESELLFIDCRKLAAPCSKV